MGSTVFPAAASGPSLAEITTAITTNAAPASVTNSSIATQVANNAPSPNAWTLVATSAQLNYNTGSVTFSGLSGYKTYKIVIPYLTLSGSTDSLGLRINSDSSADIYGRSGWSLYNNGINSQSGASTYFYISGLNSNGSIFNTNIVIKNASISSPKEIEAVASSNFTYGQFYKMDGLYNSTSAVNSLTVFCTNSAVLGYNKNIYLLGAN
jgi:hypothetical protein